MKKEEERRKKKEERRKKKEDRRKKKEERGINWEGDFIMMDTRKRTLLWAGGIYCRGLQTLPYIFEYTKVKTKHRIFTTAVVLTIEFIKY